MKNLLYLTLSLIFLFPPNNYDFLCHIEVQGDQFLTDKLGNVYVVQKNKLFKYSDKGNFLYSYDNNYLGDISSVDVSNPFKIILFYKEFNQILFLGNTLSEISEPVFFDDLGFNQVDLVCSSERGGFWIFDNVARQLLYFNKNLQVTQKSINLNSIVGLGIDPQSIVEKNSFLYINFPGYGIVLLDAYGAYYKTISVADINSFQVSKGNLLYLKGSRLIEFNIELLNTTEIELPDSNMVKGVRKEQNKIFLFNENGVNIYKLKN